MASTVDMTVGSPTKHLLKFALPLLCGNIFQQFYNIVDSVIVGQFVGANALAAVGACGSLMFFFFSLTGGLAMGIGVIVAQYFGSKDMKNVRTTISSSVYVLAGASLLVSVIAVIFAPWILRVLQTPEEIIKDSIDYMRITGGFTVFMVLYVGVSSILRALGDSKTPLIFLIVSSFLNIILDLVFVLCFHWGVTGVALATVISQGVSGIACYVYARKTNEYFDFSKKDLIPNRHIIFISIKLGIPIALQNSLISISCIVLQTVVNGFGPLVMAAFTITNRVEGIIHQPFSSLSMAMSTYAGQNAGAHQFDRVKKGLGRATIMTLIISILMALMMYTLGPYICRLFVKETDVIEIGTKALRITALCYFGLGMIYVPRGLLNGTGDTGFAMINGLTEVFARIFGAVVLTKIASIGYWGVWVTNGFTWTFTAIICLIRYFSGVWKKKSLV